ncbi:hypothetical protein DL93DRAFT_2165403 [Clavulina sp. PMI_390]|nr:hypothetical protein DL93DRAFT_2165403 [Clavulina sp. PMI_390]
MSTTSPSSSSQAPTSSTTASTTGPTYVLGPSTPIGGHGLALGVKLGVVIGIIAVTLFAVLAGLILWCRLRSIRRQRFAERARRRRSSTGPRASTASSQISALNVLYPDPTLVNSASYDIPGLNGPHMTYHPSETGRTRRFTRAADTDAQGRRGGVHPDDLTGKEMLPAYSAPNPGQRLPTYIEIEMLPTSPSSATDLIPDTPPIASTPDPVDHPHPHSHLHPSDAHTDSSRPHSPDHEIPHDSPV